MKTSVMSKCLLNFAEDLCAPSQSKHSMSAQIKCSYLANSLPVISADAGLVLLNTENSMFYFCIHFSVKHQRSFLVFTHQHLRE